MQVPFRQGIVKAIPNFLQLTGSTVSLVIPQPAYVLVTIADGTSDYLISENASVSNAWTGPFSSGVDYWLFWELHPITGAKMYGHTLYEPIESTIAPTSPVNDQHWFDSTAGKMKVWNGTASRWVEKIRVFAARLTSATQIVSMSINSPSFEGTQVGSYLSTQVLAGYIVLDNEGKALRKGNGKFFTTEEVGVSGVTHASRVKFSSIVREAEAAANMANLTIVAFTDFDTIVPATPSMVTQGKLFGIIEEDVIIGGFVNVVFEGMVSSTDWDWTTLGINAPLYIGAGGVLSATATPPALTPIAVVSGIHSIQFGVPKVVTVGGSIVDVMSTTVQGTGKLSLAAVNPGDPIVVGDNDPRLTDARTPVAHTHGEYVEVVGDTMTGFLTLHANPTSNLHAATKQYVDANAGSVSAPTKELVYGTGTGVASSPYLTHDSVTSSLYVNYDPLAGHISATTPGRIRLFGADTLVDAGVNSAGSLEVEMGHAYNAGGGGGFVTVKAGDSSAPSGSGGLVSLAAGGALGSGLGGNLILSAGLSINGRGGDVSINSGNSQGASSGGDMTLQAGYSGSATGGSINIIGGFTQSGSDGGSVVLRGGEASSATGGSVTIAAGADIVEGDWSPTIIVRGRNPFANDNRVAEIRLHAEVVRQYPEDPGKDSPVTSSQHSLFATTTDQITPSYMAYGSTTRKVLVKSNTITQFELHITAYTAATGDAYSAIYQGVIRNYDMVFGVLGTIMTTVLVESTTGYSVTVSCDSYTNELLIAVAGSGTSPNDTVWGATLYTTETHLVPLG